MRCVCLRVCWYCLLGWQFLSLHILLLVTFSDGMCVSVRAWVSKSERKSGSGNGQQCSLLGRPHYTQIDWDCVSSLNNTVHDATTSIQQDFNGLFAHGVCACVWLKFYERTRIGDWRKEWIGNRSKVLKRIWKFHHPFNLLRKYRQLVGCWHATKTTAIVFHPIP